MQVEHQVPTAEECRELKALGFPQESPLCSWWLKERLLKKTQYVFTFLRLDVELGAEEYAAPLLHEIIQTLDCGVVIQRPLPAHHPPPGESDANYRPYRLVATPDKDKPTIVVGPGYNPASLAAQLWIQLNTPSS